MQSSAATVEFQLDTKMRKKMCDYFKNTEHFAWKWDITVQIPTRIPEKIVVALFSGILVNSGILVVAGRLQNNGKCVILLTQGIKVAKDPLTAF